MTVKADEIKRRLTDVRQIVDRLGIGDGAKKQAGGLLVCCPWHNEKNPSCSVTVSDSTIRAKCQACGNGGDVFNLIAAVRGWDVKTDFPKVLAEAGGLAGLPMNGSHKVGNGKAIHTPADIWALLEREDEAGIAYLKSRGVTWPADVRFVTGSSPGASHFGGKGWTLAIPLRNLDDKIVALKLRRIDEEGGKNERFRAIGSTSSGLFGDVPRMASAARIVVCEGAIDTTIAKTAIAAADVAVVGLDSASHLDPLKAFDCKGKEVVIATDADEAGDEAAKTIAAVLASRGASVYRARVTVGKDVGEYHQAGEDVADLIASATKIETPAAPGLPTVKVGDVPDPGPVQWLVRDLWTLFAVGMVAGEPKTFKSFLSAYLAVCVAGGKPAFGKEVTQGRVLMFNAEDRPAMTRKRIEEMCRAMDLSLADLDLHLVDVPQLRLDDHEQIALLNSTVASVKPALLVLDPLRNLHDGDENEARHMNAVLAPLRLIQREHNTSVMLVHHMAKQGDTPRRGGQRMRGSSVVHGWLDSALYVTGTGGPMRVEVEHREAPTVPGGKFMFVLKGAPKDGGTATWLEVFGGQAGEADKEGTSDAQRILDDTKLEGLLKASKGPLTGNDISKAWKGTGGKDRAAAAIERFKEAGRIVLTDFKRVDAGGRTQPLKGWVLRREPEQIEMAQGAEEK